MGNLGGGEILVILLVALIFLGPEKLPEVARQVGKVMTEVRRVTSGFQREMQDAIRLIDNAAKETPRPVDAIVTEAATVDSAAVEPAEAPPHDGIDAASSMIATASETPPLTITEGG